MFIKYYIKEKGQKGKKTGKKNLVTDCLHVTFTH